ncbi:MAG: poly(A) polymerase [Phycisphaerae bacterium]
MSERGIASIQDAGMAVVRRLREHGHEALWAGGCVRDMLLGRAPTDIDVATDALPDEIITLFRHTRKVGVQFGVVLVRQGRYWIETATFRQDLDYADGRRPDQVIFTNAEHDAQRRDFTINGLFYDPIEQRVIDYVGGQQDLAAGVIRAIGKPEERFAEDHLRMLRAARFTARFGFQLDPPTGVAIRRHAARLVRISPERIREELQKMFEQPARAEAMRLIADLNLLPYLWPAAQADWPAGRADQAVEVLAALPPGADFVLCMAGMLNRQSPAGGERIGRALRMSNHEIADLCWLVGSHPRVGQAANMSAATFKKLMAHPRREDLLALHRAACIAEGFPLDAYERAWRRLEQLPREDLAPLPLVTGDDLIGLGLKPGPVFKSVLDELYDQQLNGELPDRAAALERLRLRVAQMFSPENGSPAAEP